MSLISPLTVEAVSTLMREVAASEILPRFRQLGSADVWEKSPNSLVTVADEAAERVLTQRLPKILSGSLVVGEESVAADPAILGRLSGSDPVWIVDPVDGTAHFAAGRPTFGVMVALAVGGETQAGWIYDPLGNRMATGVKGQGAWLNGTRLKLPTPGKMPKITAYIGPIRRKSSGTFNGFSIQPPLFCAAHDYLRLLTGELDILGFRRTMPWDHAAGTLLHAEAGGFSARLDGEPYLPDSSPDDLLLAFDKALWSNAQKALQSSD